MIQLRPYQDEGANAIREAYRAGHRSVLYVSPTGSGKTVLFSYLASRHITKPGRRVYVLVHRTELVEQVLAALRDENINAGVIAADYLDHASAPVQVCSVQTLVRRLERYQAPTFLICDEAHHATDSTTWGKVIAAYPHAHVLGVTATPTRLSGEGLSDCFQTMILGPTTQKLIDLGALSPVRVYAPPSEDLSGLHTRMGDFIRGEMVAALDKPKITGDALEHYKKLAPGQQAIAFCISVEHAHHVAEQFRQAGFSAEGLDGGLDRERRNRIVTDFRQRRVQVLCSCDLISEGFDVPGVSVGISLRPTQSLGLWLQQTGRILRPAPGKTHALILDHAGNTLRHGLPTEDREWTLEGTTSDRHSQPQEKLSSVRICTYCFAASPSTSSECVSCGSPFVVTPRTVQQEIGDLTEITPALAEKLRAKRERLKVQGAARTLEALTELGKIKGYRDPARWAQHVYEARQARGRA